MVQPSPRGRTQASSRTGKVQRSSRCQSRNWTPILVWNWCSRGQQRASFLQDPCLKSSVPSVEPTTKEDKETHSCRRRCRSASPHPGHCEGWCPAASCTVTLRTHGCVVTLCQDFLSPLANWRWDPDHSYGLAQGVETVLIWSSLQRRCSPPPPSGEELLFHPEQAGLPATSKAGGRLLCQRTVRSPGQLNNSSVHRRKWDFFFFFALEPMWLHIISPHFTSADWFFLFLHTLDISAAAAFASRMFVLRKQEEKNWIILIAMWEYVQPRAFFSFFSLNDCSMAPAQWPVVRRLTPTSSVHVTYALVITRMTLQNYTYAQEKCVTDRNSSSAFALHCCFALSCSVCIGC